MSLLSDLDDRVALQSPQRRPGAVSPGPIDLQVYDDLDSVEAVWRGFEGEADCTPFQTFAWLAAYVRHVAPHTGVSLAVVVGRVHGEVLFIVPMEVSGGLVRRLSFLGQDLCDYNAPLLSKQFASCVASEDFPNVWLRCIDALQRHPRLGLDLVSLAKMPERVGGQLNPFMALAVRENPSHAYQAHMGETWKAYYEERRSSATRRRDRTKHKRLSEIGEVRFITPDGRDDIARTMEVLFSQKAKSLQRMGVSDIFARPGWRDFFLDLASNPQTRHLVHVSRLDVGPTWSAINFGLTFRDCYFHILASYDDGETSRFGPGAAHLRELLRYAVEHGRRCFDFTIGDERYKREWSDVTMTLYDHVQAAGMRGLPAAVLAAATRSIRRTIKQNETLWSLASRARAALARKAPEQPAAPTAVKSPPIAPE